MLRIFTKRGISAIRGMLRKTAITPQIGNVTSKSTIDVASSSVTLQVAWRWYSEATPEPMIAEYDYVKKATTNDRVVIIDVREQDELKEHGKIPNSINIPLGNVHSVLSTMSDSEFEKTYKRSKPGKDTEIIFYCMIGKRSGKAQQSAIELGFKNTKNYLGSWSDWAAKQIH